MNAFLRYLYNLSEAGYSFEQALLPELKRFLENDSASMRVVLDFGCGQKPFEYLFRNCPFDGLYVGIDVYPGQTVDVIYNGNDMPFRDSTFDLILSASVFEHIENLESVLIEMRRVLKDSGMILGVVPFTYHVHGSPFDYNRLTRYGWTNMVKKVFNDEVSIDVKSVDGRINCLINIITGQINAVMLDMMRFLRNLSRKNVSKLLLSEGGASPESHNSFEMRFAYAILRLNPINFILGIIAWMASYIPIYRCSEGEITSGYLIKVTSKKPGRVEVTYR